MDHLSIIAGLKVSTEVLAVGGCLHDPLAQLHASGNPLSPNIISLPDLISSLLEMCYLFVWETGHRYRLDTVRGVDTTPEKQKKASDGCSNKACLQHTHSANFSS